MTTNGYVKMWDNWSKKRYSIPVYDLWLDEYKDILDKNKDSEILSKMLNKKVYFYIEKNNLYKGVE